MVFNQKKYTIPGETLLSVGGFIDNGESPLMAAKREVLKELGLGSWQTLRAIREKNLGYSNGRDVRANPRMTLEVPAVSRIITSSANL